MSGYRFRFDRGFVTMTQLASAMAQYVIDNIIYIADKVSVFVFVNVDVCRRSWFLCNDNRK